MQQLKLKIRRDHCAKILKELNVGHSNRDMRLDWWADALSPRPHLEKLSLQDSRKQEVDVSVLCDLAYLTKARSQSVC